MKQAGKLQRLYLCRKAPCSISDYFPIIAVGQLLHVWLHASTRLPEKVNLSITNSMPNGIIYSETELTHLQVPLTQINELVQNIARGAFANYTLQATSTRHNDQPTKYRRLTIRRDTTILNNTLEIRRPSYIHHEDIYGLTYLICRLSLVG